MREKVGNAARDDQSIKCCKPLPRGMTKCLTGIIPSNGCFTLSPQTEPSMFPKTNHKKRTYLCPRSGPRVPSLEVPNSQLPTLEHPCPSPCSSPTVPTPYIRHSK